MAGPSNYPYGFSNGVTIRNLAVNISPTGAIYYVNNSTVVPIGGIAGSNGNPGTYQKPFSTIDFAIGQCVAGRGDIIYVMPNHVENLTTASGIDADVDNISIIGLGTGTDQAKVTFSNTAATFDIDADGVTVSNLWFEATISAVVVGLNVKSGSSGYQIVGNRFTSETITTDEFLDSISVTTSNGGTISGNYIDMDAGGAESGIHLVGACLGVDITNNYVRGLFSAGCIESITAAPKQVLIDGNTLINGGPSTLNTVACITMLTATSGVIQNNNLYTNVATPLTGAIVADAMFLGGNNFISTTAEAPPIEPESAGLGGIIYSTAKAGVADEATAVLWDVTGVVNVYGVVGHTETAFNSAVQVSLATDCTDETLNATLSTAVEAQTLVAVGDTIKSASVGSIYVRAADPGTTTPTWPSPARVTAGTITQVIGGTPGAGVLDYGIIWSPVTAGATVAVE